MLLLKGKLSGGECCIKLWCFPSLDDTPNHTNSSKEVPSSAVLRSLQVNVGPDGEETRAQTVQKSPEFLSTPESPSLLQDLQPSDSTSFILLNLTRAGAFWSFQNSTQFLGEKVRGGPIFNTDKMQRIFII